MTLMWDGGVPKDLNFLEHERISACPWEGVVAMMKGVMSSGNQENL